MKFRNFVKFLLLIYVTAFHFVIGQVNENEEIIINYDCTKYYNYIEGNSKKYDYTCCFEREINCDDNGYITYLEM